MCAAAGKHDIGSYDCGSSQFCCGPASGGTTPTTVDLTVTSVDNTLNPTVGTSMSFSAVIQKTGSGTLDSDFRTSLIIDVNNDGSPDVFPNHQSTTPTSSYTGT